MGQIRGVFGIFGKNQSYTSPGGGFLRPKCIFTPLSRLHTVTTGSGEGPFGYSLRPFHVLIEIYPVVPFPPSVREGVSDVTAGTPSGGDP